MISDPQESILQLTAITGCNDYQAEVVLKRCDWDINVAVNSYFDNPPPEKAERLPASFTSTAVAPFRNEAHNAQSWDKPITYDAPAGPPPSAARRPDNNTIDLTNDVDADEDLRKAMAESLQQSNPSSRPAEPTMGNNGDVQMSEDEQLRQALEASVQSHHDLLHGNGSGARTPALPQHLDVEQHRRRPANAPVALVAPYSSLDVIALVLQALYAAAPARQAYLTSVPVVDSTSDLLNYWKGASPTRDDDHQQPRRGRSATAHGSFELTQRIQLLFSYMTSSYRSLCVIKDVSSLAPSEVVARGVDNSAAIKVATLLFQFLMDQYDEHVRLVKESMPPHLNDSEPAVTPFSETYLFKSAGAAALTAPTTPLKERDVLAPSPSLQNTRHYVLLRHDSVDADVFSCLRAALANDGEGALLTHPAKVLNMGIEHATDTAFRVDERIYLDSLMWDRRQGVRLESEHHNAELGRLEYIIQQLHARKRKLTGDNGKLAIDLLDQSKHYFDQVATSNDQDAVRASMHREAVPRLANIVEALQQDLAATDQLIIRTEAKMVDKRSQMQQRARQEADNPKWKQVSYDLCAVLCQDALGLASYVKQPDASWWKVASGTVEAISADTIPSHGVFWVVYCESAASAEAAESCVPETVQSAISEDNLTFESELLSLIVSDTSSVGDADAHATPTLLSDTTITQ